MPQQEPQIASNTDHGLIGWLENTRVPLPLKGVEARFEVVGEVAHVELDQIYHQTAAKALDCLYTFPLPAEAAVHLCEFHVNGRVISAKVEELQQARRQYQEAKQSGRRAALMQSERANLFTLSLANVQPNDLVVVRLAYIQTLERVGGERRLRVPFCPGIRYIPGHPLLRAPQGRGTVDDTDQVPDASRLSPPRIDAMHPDAAYLALNGVLKIPAAEFSRITTKSHGLKTQASAEQIVVELDPNDAVPDQDFLLGWELNPAVELQPRAWTATRGEWQYALVELRAPKPVNQHPREPMDVYFLLDRSGSMAGQKWDQACVALNALVGQLEPADRIRVTWFESSFGDFTASPVPAANFSAAWPVRRLQEFGTAGGTELLPALNHVLEEVHRHSLERKPVLVLLTDGQVGNEAAVAATLQTHPRLVLHAFGICTAINDALLTQLTRQQRGRCVLLRPDEDIPAAVSRLGTLLAHPVVTGLQTPAGWETANGPLPDLYAGEAATATLRGRVGSPLSLSGRAPDGRECSLALKFQATDSPAIALLWAKRRLALLEAQHQFAAAVSLSKEFNLVGAGTAFVAWDEVEKVIVAADEVYQPALQPAVWAEKCSLGSMKFRSLRPPREIRDVGATLGEYSGLIQEDEFTLRASSAAYIRPPEPTPTWAQEPLFLEPGGDRLMALIHAWLDGCSQPKRDLAQLRLSRLIKAVVGTAVRIPRDQLAELARRLASLLGTTGRFAEELQNLCQRFGWSGCP